MDNQYELLLAFDTDDPEFTRGVEVGRLWEILMDGVRDPVVETVHASNAEMVLRLAEAVSARRGEPVYASSVELGDGWIEATFSPEPQQVKLP